MSSSSFNPDDFNLGWLDEPGNFSPGSPLLQAARTQAPSMPQATPASIRPDLDSKVQQDHKPAEAPGHKRTHEAAGTDRAIQTIPPSQPSSGFSAASTAMEETKQPQVLLNQQALDVLNLVESSLKFIAQLKNQPQLLLLFLNAPLQKAFFNFLTSKYANFLDWFFVPGNRAAMAMPPVPAPSFATTPEAMASLMTQLPHFGITDKIILDLFVLQIGLLGESPEHLAYYLDLPASKAIFHRLAHPEHSADPNPFSTALRELAEKVEKQDTLVNSIPDKERKQHNAASRASSSSTSGIFIATGFPLTAPVALQDRLPNTPTVEDAQTAATPDLAPLSAAAPSSSPGRQAMELAEACGRAPQRMRSNSPSLPVLFSPRGGAPQAQSLHLNPVLRAPAPDPRQDHHPAR